MGAEVKFVQPTFQEQEQKRGQIMARILLSGNTTLASITGACTNLSGYEDIVVPPLNIGGLKVYVQAGGAPTVADPTANLGTLTNGANSVIGIVAHVRDADELVAVTLHADRLVKTGADIGSVTTITPAYKGVSTTGVTSLNNLAFALTLNGVNLGSAIGTEQFWISILYTRKPYTA